MGTIINAPRRFKLYAAAMVMAALVITLLAVAYATGPAQAQDDTNLNAGKYADPQPCGIGVSAVPENPDEEFSEGHVALFDAYWDYNTQTLNNNLCPPLAEHEIIKDDIEGDTIVTHRTKSNIDVNTTDFHAGDEFKHTITDAEKAKYPFLPPAGTQVWWLKQDDPIAEAAEPEGEDEPELVLGLSAGLFKEEDWYREPLGDDSTELKPLQYEFEAERDTQGNVIPFVVFENDAKEPIWDSRNADTNSIEIDPGEYRHYNWVFFPGPGQSHTYVLEVHMKGHVRIKVPEGRTKDNWKPLTWPKDRPHDPDNKIVYDEIVRGINKTVTSEVRKEKYTIHVGPLHLNEQPQLGVYRVAYEGAAAETYVGEPIAVYGLDRDSLKVALEGDGKEDFSYLKLEYGTGVGVQITVAKSDNLVYPKRPYYDLQITVSDGHNRTDGPDDTIDDTIPVRIQVFPTDRPYVILGITNEYPRIGEDVYTDAAVYGLPSGSTVTGYTLWEKTVTRQDDGTYVDNWETVSPEPGQTDDWARFKFKREKPGTRSYKVEVSYNVDGGDPATNKSVESALYPLTWRR